MRENILPKSPTAVHCAVSKRDDTPFYSPMINEDDPKSERNYPNPRTDCDAPCFEQLKATHLRASPKQQALLDVLLQLIKTWPLTIGP